MKKATITGVINIPIKFENDALHTAPATLPCATEVNAIEDCTVDGKKHINKKPQYNSCPSSGTNTGLASKPKTGKRMKVNAKTKRVEFPMHHALNHGFTGEFSAMQKE